MEGGVLSMRLLELTGFTGHTRGGVVAMRGQGDQTLSLTSCVFAGNSAEWYGGAVYAYGADGDVPGSASLVVVRSRFENNSALYNGGAVHFNGLYGSVTASFVDSVWSMNRAVHGGGIADLFGRLTAANCTFEGNEGVSSGGGYYQYTAAGSPGASSVFSNCTFAGNTAAGGQGTATLGADLHFHTAAEGNSDNAALLCAVEASSVYANEADVVISGNVEDCVLQN